MEDQLESQSGSVATPNPEPDISPPPWRSICPYLDRQLFMPERVHSEYDGNKGIIVAYWNRVLN